MDYGQRTWNVFQFFFMTTVMSKPTELWMPVVEGIVRAGAGLQLYIRAMTDKVSSDPKPPSASLLRKLSYSG